MDHESQSTGDDYDPEAIAATLEKRPPKPRVQGPQRRQAAVRFELLEDALPIEHPARLLWQVLGRLDLSRFLRHAKAVDGHAGRSTTCPRMLLTLWFYAISKGIASAREIERLTMTDLVFRWISGGTVVSRETISKFRRRHGEAFSHLFTEVLGILINKGLLSLNTVAIDGMRVRASASAPSLRGQKALEQAKEHAQLHLEVVLKTQDDPALSSAQRAARLAGAKDYLRRVEEASAECEAIASRDRPPAHPRASTTDPEVRNMKMADGGYRPAFNVQLATAGDRMGGPRTIVAAHVTNVGSDMGALQPMVNQVVDRCGTVPDIVMADANHANFAHVEAVEALGSTVIMPPNKRTKAHGRRDGRPLTPGVQNWMGRMETEEAKECYRARASVCELANAHMRSRYGLNQFLVRGLTKTSTFVIMAALTHNLLTHAVNLVG